MELRSSDAQIQLLKDTVKAYTDALNLTNDRYEGGASPLSDVTEARTQLDSARVLEMDLSVMRAQYEHAIAILNRSAAGRVSPSLPRRSISIRRPCRIFQGLYRRNCWREGRTSPQVRGRWQPRMSRSASPRRPFIPR